MNAAPPDIKPEDAEAFEGMEAGQYWRMKADFDVQVRIESLSSDDVGPWIYFSIRRVTEDVRWEGGNSLTPIEFRQTYEVLPTQRSYDPSLPLVGEEFAWREQPHKRARVESALIDAGVAFVQFSTKDTLQQGADWTKAVREMKLPEFLFAYVPLAEVATEDTGRNPDGSPRVQLVIHYMDESVAFYPVSANSSIKQGWKIDAGLGVLIIGRGYGRVIVPLCNIRSFSPEKY